MTNESVIDSRECCPGAGGADGAVKGEDGQVVRERSGAERVVEVGVDCDVLEEDGGAVVLVVVAVADVHVVHVNACDAGRGWKGRNAGLNHALAYI